MSKALPRCEGTRRIAVASWQEQRDLSLTNELELFWYRGDRVYIGD